MTQISDFPPDVQALAKRCWFADISFVDDKVGGVTAICTAIMADRASGRKIMNGGLTAHQKRVLEYLVAFIAEHGIAPSYDQIQAHLGLKSKSSVHRVIHELEERGAIQRLPNRARAITIIANPASQQEQA